MIGFSVAMIAFVKPVSLLISASPSGPTAVSRQTMFHGIDFFASSTKSIAGLPSK